jgi:hypothetical protein
MVATIAEECLTQKRKVAKYINGDGALLKT